MRIATKVPMMTDRWLRVLQVVGALPGAALAVCASVYVFTGGDPLPGEAGGRWFALIGLAFTGGCMTAIIGSVLTERAASRERARR